VRDGRVGNHREKGGGGGFFNRKKWRGLEMEVEEKDVPT